MTVQKLYENIVCRVMDQQMAAIETMNPLSHLLHILIKVQNIINWLLKS